MKKKGLPQKILYSIFHLDILEMKIKEIEVSSCQELRRVGSRTEVGVTIKGNMRRYFGHGNVLYFSYISVNVLVVVWYNIVLQDMTIGEN